MAVTKHGRQSSSRVIPAIPRALGSQRSDKSSASKSQTQKVAEVNPPAPTEQPSSDLAADTVAGDKRTAETFQDVKDESLVERDEPPGVNGEGAGHTVNVPEKAEEAGLQDVKDEDVIQNVTPTPSQPQDIPIPQVLPNLPPPFYPSHAPSDPTSSSTPDSILPTPPAMTQASPNVQGLVFGGHRDSSNASPAPASQPPPYHSQPSIQPYTGPQPQNSATFVPSNHAYHYSEPQLHYQPAFGYGPPQGPPQQQPRFYQPAHGRPPQFSRRPQDYNFLPRYQQGPAQPTAPYTIPYNNPGARPFNQPNDIPKAIHPDMMRDYVNRDHQAKHPSVSHSEGFPPFEPRGPTVPEDPTTMARFLTSQFGNAEYADVMLQLSHTNYNFPPSSHPAHRILLARSPKLRSLMSMPTGEPQDGLKVLNVPVSDRFLVIDTALIRGIMRLYGEALPDPQFLRGSATPQADGNPSDGAQMCFALALAASGHFLQIDEIISHGLLLAGRLLNWQTLPQALAFALEGGLSMAFANAEVPNREESSISSSGTPTKFDSPSSAPAYGFYSDRLLNIILSFIVHSIPPFITFSSTAPQLIDPPRLPNEAEPKHSRNPSSRLSQIRFGEMTLEDPANVDPLSTTISSILLSLPFPLLLYLSESTQLGERLSWPRMASLMSGVVQEREQRRQRAMSQKPENADEHGIWRAVRMREIVELSDRLPSGIRLVRRPEGADTPPSTASEKE